jgi:hypothetical protein
MVNWFIGSTICEQYGGSVQMVNWFTDGELVSRSMNHMDNLCRWWYMVDPKILTIRADCAHVGMVEGWWMWFHDPWIMQMVAYLLIRFLPFGERSIHIDILRCKHIWDNNNKIFSVLAKLRWPHMWTLINVFITEPTARSTVPGVTPEQAGTTCNKWNNLYQLVTFWA